jgi:hypothetical protein
MIDIRDKDTVDVALHAEFPSIVTLNMAHGPIVKLRNELISGYTISTEETRREYEEYMREINGSDEPKPWEDN